MVSAIGPIFLWLSFIAAVLQASTCWYSRIHNSFLSWLAHGQTILISGALLSLISAYIQSDFSLVSVILHSHLDQPLIYKITAAWGHHEGSLLLWLLSFALCNSFFVWQQKKNPSPPFGESTISVLGFMQSSFILFVLLFSNPFTKTFLIPENGQELNPLLQDPSIAIHPPLLYGGYVGMAIPFALSLGGLLSNGLNQTWAKLLQKWVLFVWVILTLGIGWGSFWAYYEFGWGGWWAWDPVENASLIPWLIATALLHMALISAKRGIFLYFTALLAILGWASSLMGTFLVRSGILISVHNFAVDPQRGSILLALFTLMIGGSLILYIRRWSQSTPSSSISFLVFSREGMIIFNNFFLLVVASIVFIGTVYPIFLALFTHEQISVGAPYFNQTTLPFGMGLLLLLGLGTWSRPHEAFYTTRHTISKLFARLHWPATLSVAVLLGAYWIDTSLSWYLLSMIGAASWGILSGIFYLYNILTSQQSSLRSIGMGVAHIGFAFSLLSVAIAVGWQQHQIQSLEIGDSFDMGPYKVHLDKVELKSTPSYTAEQAHLRIFYKEKLLLTLVPERHLHFIRKMVTQETALGWHRFGLLNGLIDAQVGPQRWIIRLDYHPGVTGIWLGVLLMALGGILSLIAKKKK